MRFIRHTVLRAEVDALEHIHCAVRRCIKDFGEAAVIGLLRCTQVIPAVAVQVEDVLHHLSAADVRRKNLLAAQQRFARFGQTDQTSAAVQHQLQKGPGLRKTALQLLDAAPDAVNLLKQLGIQSCNHPMLPVAAVQPLCRAVFTDISAALDAVQSGVDVAFDAVMQSTALVQRQHPLLLHLLKVDVWVRLTV